MANLGVKPSSHVENASEIIVPLRCYCSYVCHAGIMFGKGWSTPEILGKTIHEQKTRECYVPVPTVAFATLCLNSWKRSNQSFRDYMESVRKYSFCEKYTFVRDLASLLVSQQVEELYCELNLEFAQNQRDIGVFVTKVNETLNMKIL